MSHLNYALSVWGPSLNKDLFSRLCRLHDRAVCVTCGLRKYDHVSDCRPVAAFRFADSTPCFKCNV